MEDYNENLKSDIKKDTKVQLSRHIIQLISFFLFPELFITIYNSMKEIVSAVVNGNFSFSKMSPQIILTAGILLITIFIGRFFCGYMCAFGAVSDLLYSAFEKIVPKKIKPSKELDRYLKWIKYGVLGFLVIGVWIYAIPIKTSFSPWNAFGGLVSGNLNIIGKTIGTVGFLLLLVIFLGSIFIERFFCRYLCPLSAVFAPISKKRLFKIRKKAEGCNACENCTRKCSMGIEVHNKISVDSGECIDCMKCISSCPNESLETNPAPIAVGVAAAVAIAGLVGAERISQNGGYQPEISAKAEYGFKEKNHNFENNGGNREGDNAGHGFRGKNDGNREGDNAGHGFRGKNDGNREGDNAGHGFRDKNDGNGEEENSGHDSNAENKKPETNSENGSADSKKIDLSKISDGDYTGTGNGFRGEIKVKVTVKDHKIENISIESSRDDREFLNKASSRLIQEIISSQSVEVDAVSGATFSSNGILEAVKNALGTTL